MSITGLRNLDHAVHTTNIWIRDVNEKLGWDSREKSYMALKAVLHGLRDQLTTDESAHFAAQLPLFIRGVYYEGWRPTQTPARDRALNKFLDRVCQGYTQAPGPHMIDPLWICRAVIAVLSDHVSKGELDDVRGMLPESIRSEIWPIATNGGGPPAPQL